MTISGKVIMFEECKRGKDKTKSIYQKQPSSGIFRERCGANMQQICSKFAGEKP